MMAEEAIPHLQKALLVEDDESGAYLNLGHCYSRAGDLENALAAFENAVKLDLNAKTLYLLGEGGPLESRARRRSTPNTGSAITTSASSACLHAIAGRGKDALATLEDAFRKGYSDRAHIDKDKDFDRLRRDPKFKELIENYLKK